MALDLQHVNHSGIEFAEVGFELRATVTGGGAMLEAVAGGAGFVTVSGAVTLNLALGRVFQNTAIGNLTGPTFTNVPAAAGSSPAWKWVVRKDATSTATVYAITGTPAVTFVDGRSFADADLTTPNAVNTFVFWVDGAVTYGALVTNGSLAFDPYKACFLANETIDILTEAESIDIPNATQYGTGTITYHKNGGAEITTRTTFAVGDRLNIECTGISGRVSVRVPRYAL